jgi:hypothetical protein
MFGIFRKKDSYHFIPDSVQVEVDEPRFDSGIESRIDPANTLPPLPNKQLRYRGDKRLIERGGDFHQSTGKIALRKRIRKRNFRALYSMDLFHSLVDAPTSRIIAILMGGYLSIVVVFAAIYYAISYWCDCAMDLDTPMHALFFSLETMATIGFSTTDIFFKDCIITLLVLAVQICVKLIVDAVVIGVLYCKLSRPSSRASTVIFSKTAVIRRIRGKLYFMFQLCELRKHQLVEAHVRVYAVRKEIDLASCFTEDADDEEQSTAPTPGIRKLQSQKSAFGFAWQNSSMSSEDGSMEGLLEEGNSAKSSQPPKMDVNPMQYHVLPDLTPAAAEQLQRAQRPSYMQTCGMRLNHPNDELGGMLLLMTPQVVVHEVDAGYMLAYTARATCS